MKDIMTMTEEEIIAAYANPVETKVTVTFANGMTTEMSQEEAISRRQELLMRDADTDF